MQLEAISLPLIACFLGQQINPQIATASFWVTVESDNVTPEPPFLQVKQPQLSLTGLSRSFKALLLLLDLLQNLRILLVVRSPELDTGLKM